MCCGSLALSCCGCASIKACGECRPKTNASRYPYAILLVIASMFALLLQKIGSTKIIGDWAICDVIRSHYCSDNAGAQRIFFVLSLFFIIHAVTVYFWANFHKILWCPKVLITCLWMIVTFFIDNEPFEAYSHFARYMAGLFLLFQIVIIINMLYELGDYCFCFWFCSIVLVCLIVKIFHYNILSFVVFFLTVGMKNGLLKKDIN